MSETVLHHDSHKLQHINISATRDAFVGAVQQTVTFPTCWYTLVHYPSSLILPTLTCLSICLPVLLLHMTKAEMG